MLAEAPRKLNLGDDVTVSANGCSSQSHLTSNIAALMTGAHQEVDGCTHTRSHARTPRLS